MTNDEGYPANVNWEGAEPEYQLIIIEENGAQKFIVDSDSLIETLNYCRLLIEENLPINTHDSNLRLLEYMSQNAVALLAKFVGLKRKGSNSD
jgi:hypothetical protein